jgi:endonuclease III
MREAGSRGASPSIPTDEAWDRIVSLLAEAARGDMPSVSRVMRDSGSADGRPDPFSVLVSTVISLRTKDAVTVVASRRLLARAGDPASLAALTEEEIGSLIYPAGFYRTKAKSLRTIAGLLIESHGGKVPADIDSLLALPGVGRKTANLVLSEAFGIDAICVDTHVHRISNRFGWVATGDPGATEEALMKVLPRRHWRTINPLLVLYGQRICTPLSPHCSSCVLYGDCGRVGVGKRR